MEGGLIYASTMTTVMASLIVIVVTLIIGLIASFKTGQAKRLTAVEILQLLRLNRVFPVDPAQSWRLVGVVSEHRVWQYIFQSPTVGKLPYTVYGCYSKVKGSSQMVLNTLKDITKYSEWDFNLHNVKVITSAQEVKDTGSSSKTKMSASTPVQHDMISVQTDFVASRLIRLLNSLSVKLQGEAFLKKTSHIDRLWHKEENGCCWMLEMDEGLQEWTFYLAQPAERWFEVEQCMLTIISRPHPDRCTPIQHWPAIKLSALTNYFSYKKVQSTPLGVITLPSADQEDLAAPDMETTGGSAVPTTQAAGTGGAAAAAATANLPTSPSKARNLWEDFTKFVTTKDEKRTEPAFISKFRNLIDEKRKASAEKNAERTEMAANILQHKVTNPQHVRKLSVDENTARRIHSQEEQPLKDLPQRSYSVDLGNPKMDAAKAFMKTLISNPEAGDGDEGPKARRRLRLDLPAKSRSLTEDSVEGRTPADTRPTERPAAPAELDNAEDNASLYSPIDLEDLTEEERIKIGYRRAANEAAADILAEKMRVSQIDISQPYEQQAESTGGWLYCGLERDVVILRKIYEDGTPLQSFLGKGMIPCAPQTVFEAIRNPTTRFTYDEMLKKMNTVHDFGDGLKIIYYYHEVSQLFKKESRDFCVLQGERMQGSKYIISLKSVGWPTCEETDGLVRGKFLSSGWIIEPAMSKDKQMYSMVTYISQMELKSSKTTSGYLVEELAAKQPLCIALLRQYLAPTVTTPHTAPSTGPTATATTATAAARKRTPSGQSMGIVNGNRETSQGSTLATVAASAAKVAALGRESMDRGRETDAIQPASPSPSCVHPVYRS